MFPARAALFQDTQISEKNRAGVTSADVGIMANSTTRDLE